MALVTREITEDSDTYTISTLYAALSINALFSFISVYENFRYSEDGGNTWSDWNTLTAENIRLVNIEVNNQNVVVQVTKILESLALLINETDHNIINNDQDKLLIT